MTRLEAIGLWFNERAPGPCPLPQLLVSHWPDDVRDAVRRYLRAGATLVAYFGGSYCRFACGERDMGCRDLTDGTFAWPEGLVHYVDRHEVRLPERFVAHVLSRGAVVAPFEVPEPTFGLVDHRPWLAWARAQGACLDLDGWAIPTPDDARRIHDELGCEGYVHVALCRGATREVVLALGDGSLEVRQLRAGGHRPRRLANWQAWPRAC